ncbi:Arc family DNA-binding protein [Agrobacterium tumefaciens]|uniref:Arc family DNA-binding protein n=1 Tax=Agrobacterium tumefaciens TaxID=358 RepID=UPI001574C7B3|nr:Arc family DNA-binding protein [Agrobacterium tumefaciens]NTA48011.1 Arc family DNA-binding protein [Agrobacterium tumefaciens]
MTEKEKYPSELAERFQIRLPPGLRDRIKATAEANGRSMNTEIVSTLEEAYPDPLQFMEELKFLDEIDEIQRKLDRLRAAQLAEASRNFSQDFIDANAKKIKRKRKGSDDTGDEE